MTRMTIRLEDGQAAMDCIACARQGVVCHLLSCRNRLKNRLCDYEDVMQSNGLIEQKHGHWVSDKTDILFHCSECETQISTNWDYDDLQWNYCPNCGAKMDGEMKDND